mmetsp:Transcript_12519/g.27160  ORF Transcript_12519/g.27160 Transcript_12519/m.27160 type:complete len:224 (-) Transcript_12519:642-1313(-)
MLFLVFTLDVDPACKDFLVTDARCVAVPMLLVKLFEISIMQHPQIIEMLTLPLQQHLAEPITLHWRPVESQIVQLLNPLLIHQCLLVICLPLFVFLPLAVDPIIESWPTFCVGTDDDVAMLLLVFYQTLIMSFPIGIDAGEHVGAFLGNEGTGTHGVKVEPNFFELSEALGVEAFAAYLVQELALSSNPVSELGMFPGPHTTNQTVAMLCLVLLNREKLFVPL